MKTVFFDIDTQLDFVVPAGALYAPGAEKILDHVAALNMRAPLVISTVDAHSENDPEFRQWPHHCVTGCLGQRKLHSTLLENRVVIHNEPAEEGDGPLNQGSASTVIDSRRTVPFFRPPAIPPGCRQIILEKQTVDCFTNRHLDAILQTLKADRYVVYGVVTEICVKNAAFGLLKTGKPVFIVTDAIRALNDATAAQMLAEFQAAGGQLTTAELV